MTVTNPSSPITKLAYRVWVPVGRIPRIGALQMKGQVTMLNYHFRVSAERLGVVLDTLITRTEWPEGKPGDCRFVIEAPAAEETLSMVLDDAVRLTGLRAERC